MDLGKDQAPSAPKPDIAQIRYDRTISEIKRPLSDINLQDITKEDKPLTSFSLILEDGEDFNETSRLKREFPVDVALNFGDEEPILAYPNSERPEPTFDSYYRKYNDILEKILNLSKRQIGADRLPALLENLDSERQRVHNQAANSIADYLDVWHGITIARTDPPAANDPARKLFQTYLYINQQLEPNMLFYKEDDIGRIDTAKMEQRIYDETGITITTDLYEVGVHEDNGKMQYRIFIPGNAVEKDQIKKIIDVFLAEAR